MAEKFDRQKFNTDPKHAEEREYFDGLVEDSFNRIALRKKTENGGETSDNFFDWLFNAGKKG